MLDFSPVYWTLALYPDRVSIDWAFYWVLWDIVLGSILGVHGLVLSVASHFVSKYYLLLRNLPFGFKVLLVLLFVLPFEWLFLLVEFLFTWGIFNWQEIFGAIASGVLWPWFSFINVPYVEESDYINREKADEKKFISFSF